MSNLPAAVTSDMTPTGTSSYLPSANEVWGKVIVVMRKVREVYSVSRIGVLPFIEGSLRDCSKWSGSC